MAMTRPEAETKTDEESNVFEGWISHGSATPLALRPFEYWLQWQADALKVMAPHSAQWFVRRQEGAEATLLAIQRFRACKDAQSARKILRAWVEEEVGRLQADMEALNEQVRSLSQCFIGAGLRAISPGGFS